MMNIRNRDKKSFEKISNKNEKNNLNCLDDMKCNIKGEKNAKHKLSLFYWFALLTFLFILYDFAIRFQSSCDFNTDFSSSTFFKDDTKESTEPTFDDILARKHLQAISNFGRRPAGSNANEKQTPEYIINYVKEIVEKYRSEINDKSLIVTIDEHVSNMSSFPLIVFGTQHMTSVYNKLRSVVVRIHDKYNSDKLNNTAVMINCHYDSFFGGLGASDDLTSCAVMLETLHSLLRYNRRVSLRSDIILLFNGAEENFLQASHAFVTEHPWAKDVKLVVNLEAAGSGGRQMIFQASPNHPWIVDELSQILRQPFASVIGQEIFSANLIPSDTDYRIFRDFGNIPGVDFAFITNGYIYHTSYDTEDRIPQTCLRHTGDNILKIVLHLSNTNLNHSISTSEDSFLSSQRVVFFDFLGLFLISYMEQTGICLNIGMFVISLAIVIYNVFKRSSNYLKQVVLACISQAVWAFTNFVLSLILGYLLDRFGCKMSWYSVRYNVIGLFAAPLLWYFFFYHHYISKLIFRINACQESSVCHRHACFIIISICTIILTYFRLLSCYFIGMWLLFCFLNEIISNILERFSTSGLKSNILHLIRDMVSYILPFMYYLYMTYTLYDVFIPILGRTGPSYPDLVISGLTGLIFIIPGWLFASNVYTTSVSSKKWIIFMLLNFSISYYIFVHSTKFGFPYNMSEITPRKQRIFINHVTRNIRDGFGETQRFGSGFWILSLDTNNVVFLKEHLQKVLKIPMNDIFCEKRPYCGYPLLFPFANVMDKSLWIPQPPHKLTPKATLTIVDKVTLPSGVVNITMKVGGPPQSPIYIMTPESMSVTSWSLSRDPPQPIEMPSYADKNYEHYFIFYGYGDKPVTDLTFWITFLPKISSEHEHEDDINNQIEIAVAAHYLLAMTDEIEALLPLMPQWTVPTFLASTYEHIVVNFKEVSSLGQ